MKLCQFFKICLLFTVGSMFFVIPVQAGEHTEFMNEVNSSYYNLKQLGLKSFKCEFIHLTLEQLKENLALQFPADDPKVLALNNLKFYLSFNDSGEFEFESTTFEPTGNEQFDLGAQQVIAGAKEMALGFCDAWRGFVIEPFFEDLEREMVIEKMTEGIMLSSMEGAAKVDMKMEPDFRVVEVFYTENNSVSKISPYFKQETEGFLLSGYEVDVNNGQMTIKTEIDYQELEGLQMLEKVSFHIAMYGGTQNMEIIFSDYQIEKQ